jgi:hypothetical protein
MANQHSKTTLWDRIKPSFGAQTDCWQWHLKPNWNGYGRIKVDGVNTPAHRAVYEVLVGKVSSEYQLDHTCHTEDKSCRGGATCSHRLCVNPAHLEPVTVRENSQRRTNKLDSCKYGHLFTPENTATRKDRPGTRICRACGKRRRLAFEARNGK